MTPRTSGPPARRARGTGRSRPASARALSRQPGDAFMVTKEHRRFAEFADAVRRDRYIGLCYGAARRRQDPVRPAATPDGTAWSPTCGHSGSSALPAPGQADWHTARSSTPRPSAPPRASSIRESRSYTAAELGHRVAALLTRSRTSPTPSKTCGPFAELLIVDEADRLKTPALEQLRDHHDRTGIGLILIGMPGIEKRLARYPQLYSRVGFVHHYRPLSADELAFVLATHWPELGLDDTADFTTGEAVAAITRITSGNFRLTGRLVAQIQRILDINHLSRRHQGSRRGSTRIARHRGHVRAHAASQPSRAAGTRAI